MALQRLGNQVHLFQAEVGSLRIERLVVRAEVVELVKRHTDFVVAGQLDDHRTGSHIAKTLVVAGNEHDEDAKETKGRAVGNPQQPPHD